MLKKINQRKGKNMTKYKKEKMKSLGMSLEEFLEYENEKKKASDLRRMIGNKKYYELKALNMNVDEMKKYLIQKEEEREVIKHLGYYEFSKLKESGARTIEEYEQHKKEEREQKKNISDEKNKIRCLTIRFIERHCNIERRCQICDKKAEIHHPNYKDYLKVNFLCKQHHTALHNFELIPPPIIDLEKISDKSQVKQKEAK